MPEIKDRRARHVGGKLRFTTATDPVVNQDARTASFIFSDESVDRYGDVIAARGWVLDNFNANPIALFGHDAGSVENVIGKAKNVRIEGSCLVGDIEFMDGATNPNAEAVYQMVCGGWLKTVSVGFMPIEWKASKERKGGVDFSKQELLEISIVPLPANPNAVALAKAAGIDVARLGLIVQTEKEIAPTAPAVKTFRDLRTIAVTKGLDHVAQLCSLVEYCDYVVSRVEDEADNEGDGSPNPSRLREWVNEGNRCVNALCGEETNENIVGTQGSEYRDMAALIKRAVDTALAAAGVVAKGGKAISARNEKHLKSAAEHCESAGKHIMNVLTPPDDADPEDGQDEEDPTDDPDSEERALRARKAKARAARHGLAD